MVKKIGNLYVLCNGKIFLGPDWKSLIGTVFMVLVPSVLFLILIASDMGANIFWISTLLICFNLTMLFFTALSNPGIIPRHPAINERNYRMIPHNRTKDFQINGYTVTTKYCTTCHVYRVPRCSHCATINNCVEKFDHYCPWVGTCIGRRNYRFFLMFVFSATMLCIFVFSFSLSRLIEVTENYDDQFETALKEEPMAIILVFFTFAAFWFVGGLSAFHFYLVITNQTTYEHIRRRFGRHGNPYDKGACMNLFEACCQLNPPYDWDDDGCNMSATSSQTIAKTPMEIPAGVITDPTLMAMQQAAKEQAARRNDIESRIPNSIEIDNGPNHSFLNYINSTEQVPEYPESLYTSVSSNNIEETLQTRTLGMTNQNYPKGMQFASNTIMNTDISLDEEAQDPPHSFEEDGKTRGQSMTSSVNMEKGSEGTQRGRDIELVSSHLSSGDNMISSNPEDPHIQQHQKQSSKYHHQVQHEDKSMQVLQRKSHSHSDYPSIPNNNQHLSKLSPKHSSMKAISVLEKYKMSRYQYYIKSQDLDYKSNLKTIGNGNGNGSNPFAEHDNYLKYKMNGDEIKKEYGIHDRLSERTLSMEDIMSSRRSMGSISLDRKTSGSKETESVTSSSMMSLKGNNSSSHRSVFDGLSRKVGFKKKIKNDNLETSQKPNETINKKKTMSRSEKIEDMINEAEVIQNRTENVPPRRTFTRTRYEELVDCPESKGDEKAISTGLSKSSPHDTSEMDNNTISITHNSTDMNTHSSNENQQQQQRNYHHEFESKTSFLSSELISKNIGERLKSFAKSSLKHFNTFNKKSEYDDDNNNKDISDDNSNIQLHSIIHNNTKKIGGQYVISGFRRSKSEKKTNNEYDDDNVADEENRDTLL